MHKDSASTILEDLRVYASLIPTEAWIAMGMFGVFLVLILILKCGGEC